METTPEQHFAQSFQADAQNVFQFAGSKFWPCIRTESQDVESKFFPYIGALDDDDDETATRNGDTVWSAVQQLRRRLTIVDKDKALPIDPNDLARLNYDPTNPYAVTLRNYFGRWVDRKILTRALGAAYTGKDGSTTVNIYDVGESRVMESDGTFATAGSDLSNKTATVLTPEKLQNLGGMMDDNAVPDGDRFIAIDSWQARQMAMDSAWTYEQRRVLNEIQNGRMEQLCGFGFVILPSSYFQLNATDTEAFETIAWHRSAILATSGSGTYAPEVHIDPRPDKKYTKQIFMRMRMDASRMQGAGVIKVGLKQVTSIS